MYFLSDNISKLGCICPEKIYEAMSNCHETADLVPDTRTKGVVWFATTILNTITANELQDLIQNVDNLLVERQRSLNAKPLPEEFNKFEGNRVFKKMMEKHELMAKSHPLRH